MRVDSERIQNLIDQPQESLSVELKAWINPDEPEGVAKIIKNALAMRNHNGGYVVIGFNDKTLEPLVDNAPSSIRELFHIDKIQGMIAKYSSESFEIAVKFPQRHGQHFPVICIPTGIKTPVVAKSDLFDSEKKKKLICADTIYVRSLSSNNTPSTTQTKSTDWDRLIEICFDNREADIGRFIRRHLSAIGSDQLNSLATMIAGNFKPQISTEDLLKDYIQESEQYYEQDLKDRDETLPEHGAWEVGLILIGDIPNYSPNREFLNLLNSSNPNYTGWPVWLDPRGFPDKNIPRVIDGVWQALVITWDDIDFMRFDPKGKFFLRRALEDDMGRNERSPKPLDALDFGLSIIRTSEAIAVGMAFARSMGCVPEETSLAFAFRWTKLKGRKLNSWANPRRGISPSYVAYQDEVTVLVNVPLDTPLSALSPYVNQVVKPLFEVFNGFILNENIVEELTRNLIERKL
jgi:hypothetical protein